MNAPDPATATMTDILAFRDAEAAAQKLAYVDLIQSLVLVKRHEDARSAGPTTPATFAQFCEADSAYTAAMAKFRAAFGLLPAHLFDAYESAAEHHAATLAGREHGSHSVREQSAGWFGHNFWLSGYAPAVTPEQYGGFVKALMNSCPLPTLPPVPQA